MKKCIIIGASPLISQWIPVSDSDFVIACDGGYERTKEKHLRCDLWIGDHDSTKEVIKGIRQIELTPCKDDTDVLFAIKEGMKQGCKEFELYGCSGGRFDHFFANIQCLLFLKDHGCNGKIIDDSQEIFLLQNEAIEFYGDDEILSVFSYGNKAEHVTLKNLKYELNDATLFNSFPVGVSNEMIHKKARIEVKNGILLIILEKKFINVV